MVLRWAAGPALETEKNSREIIAHRDPWMLEAALDEVHLSGWELLIDVDEDRVAAQNPAESRPTSHYG
jgi:hypothetical protein